MAPMCDLRDDALSAAITMQSLPSSVEDAARLALRLDLPMHRIDQHSFPDGEIRLTIGPASPTAIIYASLDHPNDKLVALLFAAEALRRGGCKRIILLSPYLCYMRQDAAFREGEAISQKAVGHLLAGIADRIITVDAHLHRIHEIATVFPGIEAVNLSAMPVIAETLRREGIDPATVVIGPDAESRRWVSDLANRVGVSHAVARKTRRGDRSVEIGFDEPGLIAGRPALMIDDIVSSGGTMMACAKALAAAGATAIDAIVTHALFPATLRHDMALAGIRSIRSTHSVPHPTNAFILDDLYVSALRSELSGREMMT
jgi:ribose-phosphate pyrophosphokinase